MIHESDKIRKQKATMEYQLEKIGINIDRIKKANEELKEDRGYVRTGDREKFDEEQDRKRKAEENLREQEEKKQRTITAGEEEEFTVVEGPPEKLMNRNWPDNSKKLFDSKKYSYSKRNNTLLNKKGDFKDWKNSNNYNNNNQ